MDDLGAPRISWHEEPVPAGSRVTQVYVWAFDPDDGRVLVQDRGTQHVRRYNLPGGRPEPEDGGDPLRTAAREAMEESQIHLDLDRAVYLGYQLIEGDAEGAEPHFQLRYAVPITGYEPIAPDPDNGRLHRRYLANVDRARDLLAWGASGAAQAAAAKRAAEGFGLPVGDPAPDGYRDGAKGRYLVCHNYGMGSLYWWITARDVTEIMERIEDVVVIHKAEYVTDAEGWDLEEVDIDAADPPTPLKAMMATRDEQRGRPGFGACVGRGTVYFRCPWSDDEGGQEPWSGDGGETHYLYEIGQDQYRTRQVVQFADAPAQKMSEDDWYFNPPFDLYKPEWAGYEITREEFEAAWEAAVPVPPDEEA